MGKRGEFLEYVETVRKLTEKTIRNEYLENKEKRSKEFHVDHIVSIKDCFQYGIPEYVASDIVNLRIISATENLIKNNKSVISPEELWEMFLTRQEDLL
jgi:hypothetical protein